ncbi:MAG: hypothetical protein GY866_41730 [Proteobacteria bacterium]|nr:hypothetical protein [Pseudomonadota bacterium]
MNFKSHVIASAMVGAFFPLVGIHVLKTPIPAEELAYIVPACMFGGTFPDLDTESIPSRWYARIGLVASLICLILDKPWYAAFVCIPFLAVKAHKHRGWTHSYAVPALLTALPLVVPFVPILARYVPSEYRLTIVAYAVGIVSHLATDGRYPMKRKS